MKTRRIEEDGGLGENERNDAQKRRIKNGGEKAY